MNAFCQWCASLGREPLSGNPELIAMYVVRHADHGLAVSSIRVALTAIRTAHQIVGVGFDLSQPRFRMILEGVVRSLGISLTRQAAPAVPDVLATLPSPESPLGILEPRHAAARLRGGAAPLRASRLVHSGVARVLGRGLTMLVQRSKTDQHGDRQKVAIWANPANPVTSPLTALERWQTVREASSDFSSCISAETCIWRTLFCGMSKASRLSGTALFDKAVRA